MNKLLKLVLLLGSLVPVAWLVFYEIGNVATEDVGPQLGILAGIGLLVLVGYIYHVAVNSRFTGNRKVLWILVVFLFGSIGQLAYWVRWMRRF